MYSELHIPCKGEAIGIPIEGHCRVSHLLLLLQFCANTVVANGVRGDINGARGVVNTTMKPPRKTNSRLLLRFWFLKGKHSLDLSVFNETKCVKIYNEI